MMESEPLSQTADPWQAHLTKRSVYLPAETSSQVKQSYHIFFITGNPGRIDYYHSYLSLLKERISRNGRLNVGIHGVSLANFAEENPGGILGLQKQILHIEASLERYTASQRSISGADEADPLTKVIIIGHSVGAFIGLEILQRLRRRAKKKGNAGNIQVIGYVGLWPTVTHISESKSGRKLILQLPYYALIIGLLARALVACLGRKILERIVQMVTGFPEEAVKVTADFVASKRGVQESLYMARDEMNQIGPDQWDAEVWGAATPSEISPRPKLVFFFGTDDHWVADHTRDELMKHRGMEDGGNDMWKPKMLIDTEGIPHGFCIRHSSQAAEKTAQWVEDIIEAQKTRDQA